MTTQYHTKEEALQIGAFYAGYTDNKGRTEALSKATIQSIDLGWPHSTPAEEGRPEVKKTLEVYVIGNSKGVKVGLGIGNFRGGHDLWLVNMETGQAIRT